MKAFRLGVFIWLMIIICLAMLAGLNDWFIIKSIDVIYLFIFLGTVCLIYFKSDK